MKRKRDFLGLMLAVVFLAVVSVYGVSKPCYEDVVVHGCGASWMNQRLGFLGMGDEVHFYLDDFSADYPVFGIGSYATGCQSYTILGFSLSHDRWVLVGEIACECGVLYVANVDGVAIPSTGWSLSDYYDDDSCEFLPGPRLSGGEPCTAEQLAPAGTWGFLDRCWTQDEEPPVIGELSVSAAYSVGELVTGCCTVVDYTGVPTDASYVTVTSYAVTIGDDFDIREPIDSKLLRGRDARFCFEVETAGWSPGYYDIRLGAPFEDQEWIRVEVVAPTE